MSKSAYVFCEGGGSSLDGKVLGNLFDKLTIKPVLVPTGGKRGMPAFVQGYFAGAKVVTNKVYLAFRDRDFDFKMPDVPSLIQVPDRPRVFASYRTTIENYLLDPETFFSFIDQNKIKGTGIGSALKARQLFDKIALELKYYSAARHALGAMREKMDFDTTWTSGSGDLPKSLNEDYCKSKALALIEPSKQKADNLTKEVFEKHFSVFLEKFSGDFFENGKYLVWFNGKDLMKALRQRLGKTNFSEKQYFNFAHQQFDFRKFPDLAELFDKLNNLS